MKQDEKQTRSSHLGSKKLNRNVLIGTAATLILGGTAFGLTKLNQEAEAPMQQMKPSSETTKQTDSSKETIQKQQESKKTTKSEDQADKTSSILEHYGILQTDPADQTNRSVAARLKPEELVTVATTLKNSIEKDNDRSDRTNDNLIIQDVSKETPVDQPPIVEPNVPGETPTDPELPSIVDPVPVWVGPKVYPLIQSPIIQQNSWFQANDYFYVSTGSQSDPVITTTTIDTTIAGTQLLTITATDRQGYSDTLTIPIYVNSRPELTVSAEETTIPIGSTIDLLSFVNASDLEDGNLSSNITYTTNLDTSVEGVYTVYYKVTDSYGGYATASMNIRVENEAPSISNVDMTIPVFSAFNPETYLSQVVVKDREDPNVKLTYNETEMAAVDPTKPGVYEVSLKATDSYGKSTTVVGKITVENTPPKIVGVSNKTIYQGETFDPLEGISIIDNEEVIDLSQVIVSGEYDLSTPGEYTINLSVSDSFVETTESFVLTVLPAEEESDPDMPEEGENPSEENPTEEMPEEETIPEESKEEAQLTEDSVVDEGQAATQIVQDGNTGEEITETINE